MDLPVPSFTDGDPGRVAFARPEGFERLITDLILAWASLDSGLTFFMSDLFEMPPRNARILIGSMNIKTRIGRAKTLANHAGLSDLATLMSQMERQYEPAVKPRNVVCHMHYFGVVPGDEVRFLFGPSKATAGPPSQTTTLTLHRDYLVHSTRWALEHAMQIRDVAQALRKQPLSKWEAGPPPSHPA
ncbi:hypothetical protein [Sphingomonas sp. RB1R13]|uniref:hypothetical protein n=1 Tax=Sphingomonas sp. RB1R13 TaxID=3096159 RepID=UPI002FCA2948